MPRSVFRIPVVGGERDKTERLGPRERPESGVCLRHSSQPAAWTGQGRACWEIAWI